MPHLIVEYSANLEGFPEAQVLDASDRSMQTMRTLAQSLADGGD